MLIGLIGTRRATARATKFFQDSYGCRLFTFQSRLKILAALSFQIDIDLFKEPQCEQVFPELGGTPNDLLCRLDCALRQIQPDVFSSDLRFHPSCGAMVLVPDVHWEPDVLRIRSLGGFVIRLREKLTPVYQQVAFPVVSDFVIEFGADEELETECERVMQHYLRRQVQARERKKENAETTTPTGI